MLRVNSCTYGKAAPRFNDVQFGTKSKNKDSGINSYSAQKERNILTSADALLLYSATINSKTREMLQELQAISAKGYPQNELDELEYKALEAARNIPVPVEFPNHPLSIWGGLYLDLQDDLKLPSSAKGMMTRDIARVLNGETKPDEVVNPDVWSISYEYTNPVGGQTDIAREAPEALNKAGVNTIAISPMFNMSVNSKPVNYLEKAPDGTLYYVTPGNKTAVEKVYEGELKTGGRMDKFSVYYGEFGPNRQKTLFLYDDDMFNFGDTNTPMVYQDLPHSPERVRMAQFNNMTYELLARAKDGEVKLPDGSELKAPDKLIAHEAWQSAGLLCKMRLYSRAEDSIHSRRKSTTDYLRKLADNTAVVVHNLGDGYQGQSWDKGVMEGYFNTLYNDFARDIVQNSCIADVGKRQFMLFGTPSQRIGFYQDVLNPAHAATVLSTSIGPVSEGYRYELANQGISSKLDTIIKIKDAKGSLDVYPNGVDKKPLAATRENIKRVNADLGLRLEEILGKKVNVQPYLENYDDDIDSINPSAFARKKTYNKRLFEALLKDAAKNNSMPTPLIHGTKAPDFYEGMYGIDIENITSSTPIFTMASRLDSQKGFDTMIDAYSKLVKTYDKNDTNMPVLVISGGGDKNLANYIQAKKDDLGEYGKRILFTQNRISNSGLLLMNMTTRNCMPSDFEPYGISELKGLYAGSHVIATEVGGMKSDGEISRKIYAYDDYGADKANAITVKDYEFMCISPDWDRGARKERNSDKLAAAMKKDISLSREESLKMDINALKTDVSWDKGAIQNYMDKMKIKVSD
ncbi:TPA: glycosyltransferase [Candidatus Galligastranaerophilus faecipullorum]|nr:glycosyltransferase [Candidatus Galligastranaerophilus faecipullorum]